MQRRAQPHADTQRSAQKITERTENKARRSSIPLPFYKSATWPIKGKMSERNQKRVVLFIALESTLARRQPLCDDESGASGDGRSHTGKGANTDFH